MTKRKEPGTGPGKGNRTRTGRNTDTIQAINTEYREFNQYVKEYALKRRANSPVNMENFPNFIQALADYIEERKASGQPMTLAGLALAAGVSWDVWQKLRNGDLDHVLDEYRVAHDIPDGQSEYVTPDGVVIPLIPWSTIAKNAELHVQNQLEETAYSRQRGINPAGSIFGLKARYGWTEDTTTTTNNTLIIADKAKALDLLTMLNPCNSND